MSFKLPKPFDFHFNDLLCLFFLFNFRNSSSLREFIQWSAETEVNIDSETDGTRKSLPNVYVYSNSEGRSVDLHFGSIHNVKGRTHLSTLVVETYYKTHNIKKLVRYLCNSTKAKKQPSDYGRFKCQYVAMTRARALLCMAIPAEFVTDTQREKFIKLGWQIIDII